MSIDTSRLAMPGDEDLDFDVDGTTIVSAVRMGHEIWLRLTGGFGWWTNASGRQWSALPGDTEAEGTEIDMTIGYPSLDEATFGALMARLERWRDSSTPLRVCSAPGKLTFVMEDVDAWICLPRSAPGDRT